LRSQNSGADVVQLLLPRTDPGAIVQAIVSMALLFFVVVRLSRRDRKDAAWFIGGMGTMWFSFMVFRTLH
jgi:hypothetical protein